MRIEGQTTWRERLRSRSDCFGRADQSREDTDWKAWQYRQTQEIIEQKAASRNRRLSAASLRACIRCGFRITKTASRTKMDLSVSDPVCVAVEAVDLNLRQGTRSHDSSFLRILQAADYMHARAGDGRFSRGKTVVEKGWGGLRALLDNDWGTWKGKSRPGSCELRDYA